MLLHGIFVSVLKSIRAIYPSNKFSAAVGHRTGTNPKSFAAKVGWDRRFRSDGTPWAIGRAAFMNNEPRDISSHGSLLPVLRSSPVLSGGQLSSLVGKTGGHPPYLQLYRKSPSLTRSWWSFTIIELFLRLSVSEFTKSSRNLFRRIRSRKAFFVGHFHRDREKWDIITIVT